MAAGNRKGALRSWLLGIGRERRAGGTAPGVASWRWESRLTVVVHTKPPAPLVASYRKLASRHRPLKPLMNAHAEGGFGSGFLMLRQGAGGAAPRAYVVTNQHVVGLASRVSLQFSGSDERFDALVVDVDDDY